MKNHNSKIEEFGYKRVKDIVEASGTWSSILFKLGYKTLSHNLSTLKRYCEKYNISTEHLKRAEGYRRHEVLTEKEVFCKHSVEKPLYQSVLVRKYRQGNYTPYKCAICGQEPLWQGKELVLTLDHINGDNQDDRLDNLRWVCPNCDRQLDTYAGRNSKVKGKVFLCGEGGSKTQAQAVAIIDPKTERVVAELPSLDRVGEYLNLDKAWVHRAFRKGYKVKGFSLKAVK